MQRKIYFYIILFVALFYSFGNAQTAFYVDQTNGDDNNNGTSPSTAFQTFEKALDNVSTGTNSDGDSILIIGEYHNQSFDNDYKYTDGYDNDPHLWHAEKTILISGLNGNASNYITIKAYDNNTVLKGDGSNIFRVFNSSYLIIEDFKMQGQTDSIPLSTANALQFVYIRYNDENPLEGTVTEPAENDIHYRNEDEVNDDDNIVEETDTFTDLSDFTVVRPSFIDTRGLYMSNCNNMIIRNNKIFKIPGNGLRVSYGKNIEIYDNEVYLTSLKSYSGTHGLVVTKTKAIDSGYSVKVERNIVHHNYNEQYSWSPAKIIINPRIDEGKGISLERNNLNEWKSSNNTSRILLRNNLCYWNGYAGLNNHDGYKVDIINNTAFLNHYTNSVTYATDGVQKGRNVGISCNGGDDVKIINNISVVSVPDESSTWIGYALSSANINNLVVRNNVSYDMDGDLDLDTDITDVEVNRLVADPLFVDAPQEYHDTDYSYDFHLSNNSPAIDFADQNYPLSEDINHIYRPLLSGIDDGAYEYGKYWTGKINNSWNNSANWSDDQIPVATDSITIPPSSHYINYPKVFNNSTINKLFLYGDAQLIIGQNVEFKIE